MESQTVAPGVYILVLAMILLTAKRFEDLGLPHAIALGDPWRASDQ